MAKRWSLSAKLLVMGVSIGAVVPALGVFVYYKTQDVAKVYGHVAEENLPKTKLLGEIVFKFRAIRLQVRTVPVMGMNEARIDEQLELTKKAVGEYVAAVAEYEKLIANDTERAMFLEFKSASDEFLAFGGELLKLGENRNAEKMKEIARMVLDVCPVKAAKAEKTFAAMIELQNTEAKSNVAAAHTGEAQSNWAILIGSIVGFIFSATLATFVARSISRELQTLADELAASSGEVTSAAGQVSANGNSLSASTTEQAAALQETISAIEEISSMVAKNSENATSSKESAANSLNVARNGKEMVDSLLNEVLEIQKSTNGLMQTVKDGNQEITKIVKVIAEIESKTKVINDIVFQTKLLSFNASVEAARAGESGKGFAVVAEEVGNLAAMSGKSAKEISDLLASSVHLVQGIVTSTQTKVEKQAEESKARVDHGIELGHKCGDALTEILSGAQKVDSMVTEISQASAEQAKGVAEVSKAMHQIDQVTQENANVSSSSALAAKQLSGQASQMKSLVDRLNETIRGSEGQPGSGQVVEFARNEEEARRAA